MKKRMWDKILDILFPSDVSCVSCGKELRYDRERKFGVCESCQKEFTYIGDKEQKISNSRLNIKSFYTVFKYEDKAKEMVLRFKDGNCPYLREYIAKFIYGLILEKKIEYDFICYVPSSKEKLKTRGFDPMKLVAEYLSKLTEKKVLHLLARRNQTLDQTQSTDRYLNIKDCFYCDGDFDIKDKRLLLLDDVVTTGATASECGKILKERGGEVCLLTFTEAKSFEEYKNKIITRMNS